MGFLAAGKRNCSKLEKTLVLICKKILNMLGSYGDLGDCGKISASTVFETITDITLLKYLKSLVTSLVTCHSLFKETSKKENISSCFTSAPLKNPNACNSFQDTVSVVLSDFESQSPSALLHLVLLSGLAALRKILEVGEFSYFYKLSY